MGGWRRTCGLVGLVMALAATSCANGNEVETNAAGSSDDSAQTSDSQPANSLNPALRIATEDENGGLVSTTSQAENLSTSFGQQTPLTSTSPDTKLSAPIGTKPSVTTPNVADKPSILVFTRVATGSHQHTAVQTAVNAVKTLGQTNGFTVVATNDGATFTQDGLAGFNAVVFLLTAGDVLNGDQQKAFEAYIAGGGGYVGVHSATDTEYDWKWYGDLVGAYFKRHPTDNNIFTEWGCHCPEANVNVATVDGSTRHLPNVWRTRDEWYEFQTQPTAGTILLKVDETSYVGGQMGENHPVAWSQEIAGGRSWYTALGHHDRSYSDNNFLRHLLGGIKWAGQF